MGTNYSIADAGGVKKLLAAAAKFGIQTELDYIVRGVK